MDDRAARISNRFEVPLLVAVVLTIPVTIAQLLPASNPWLSIADVLNWAIWLTFLAELVVMLMVVPSKARWLRTHPLELAIVVLTPPFITSIVQSVRVLRLLRLARLLRLEPLVRILFSGEGVRFAALLTILTALVGGATFASVENLSLGNGLYWAVGTMTTVGAGRIYPTTAAGKVIAVIVMLVGIGFATLLIGAIADRFVRRDANVAELTDGDLLGQVRQISARLQQLERALERQNRSHTQPPSGS